MLHGILPLRNVCIVRAVVCGTCLVCILVLCFESFMSSWKRLIFLNSERSIISC